LEETIMPEKKSLGLKSALDLAMERLAQKGGAVAPLTDEQKKALAAIEQQAQAKIAEIEILASQRIVEAFAKGDAEEAQKLEEQKRADLECVRRRAEDDKELVRAGT